MKVSGFFFTLFLLSSPTAFAQSVEEATKLQYMDVPVDSVAIEKECNAQAPGGTSMISMRYALATIPLWDGETELFPVQIIEYAPFDARSTADVTYRLVAMKVSRMQYDFDTRTQTLVDRFSCAVISATEKSIYNLPPRY